MLYDGTQMASARRPRPSSRHHRGRRPPGTDLRGAESIRDRYAPLIRQKFPRIPRRVSGYNLDELLPETRIQRRARAGRQRGHLRDGARGATLRLTASPPFRRLVASGFPMRLSPPTTCRRSSRISRSVSRDSTVRLSTRCRRRTCGSTSSSCCRAGRGSCSSSSARGPARTPTRRPKISARGSAALSPPPAFRICTRRRSRSSVARARVRRSAPWRSSRARSRGWEGWEDAAVPPDRLGSYLRKLCALMREYDYDSPMYGHFGEGCVHMRINFDLETEPGILQVPRVHRSRRRHRHRSRRLALRRAWRRPVAWRTASEDVRARADGGVPRVQARCGIQTTG